MPEESRGVDIGGIRRVQGSLADDALSRTQVAHAISLDNPKFLTFYTLLGKNAKINEKYIVIFVIFAD